LNLDIFLPFTRTELQNLTLCHAQIWKNYKKTTSCNYPNFGIIYAYQYFKVILKEQVYLNEAQKNLIHHTAEQGASPNGIELKFES